MKIHIHPINKIYRLFLLFTLTGCGWHIQSPVTSVATLTSSPISTSTMFAIPTNMQTITAVVTATETPVLKPTYTALLTLSADERDRQILELLQSDPGCLLPCWWGIVPDKTTWNEAWSFLSQFDSAPYIKEYLPNSRYADFLIPVSKNISLAYGIDIKIDVINEIVHVVSVRSIESATILSVQRILTDYGQPSEVWIHTYRSYLGGPPPVDVLLFYPEQGILARYSTNLTQIKEGQNIASICLDSTPNLTLWSPDEPINFGQAQDLARLDYKKYDKPLLPLNKAIGISIEQFYNYRTKEHVCITTKLSLWPEP